MSLFNEYNYSVEELNYQLIVENMDNLKKYIIIFIDKTDHYFFNLP